MNAATVIILKWFLVMMLDGSDFGVIMEAYEGWADRAGCEQQKVVQAGIARRMEDRQGIAHTSYMCVALPGRTVKQGGGHAKDLQGERLY